MNKRSFGRQLASAAILVSMWMLPIAAFSQTQITAPKNKYKVQEDIKLGSDAANEVERQFPILGDQDATDYVGRVGRRLVAAIPPQFNQPAFNYRFKVVNASDINAFALPGGPMYVNRGMIEKARNEGEMAGVMAHEISHVALRHATAQATKQSSAKNTLGMLGMIIGGAIVGGEAGAQLGMLGAMAWMTKFSREYESQADILGSRIMASAGYDPIDLANVFRTIQAENKGGGPDWLSSHPDPGKRYEKISAEARYLNVSPNPIKLTRDFERVQARFRSMPPAKTMAQIEKDAKTGGGGGGNPTASGRYSSRVALPSTRTRSYTGLNWIRLNVPSNWQDFTSQDNAQFAPEGAYGDQGITHGAMIGIYQGEEYSFDVAADGYLNEILQGNPYLSVRSRYSRTTVAGRPGYMATLAGRSPITGRTELVNVQVARMGDGIFYITMVVPEDESFSYNNAFRNMLSSIRLSQ